MLNNKGFSLIELLVVVLILGILAAMAIPQYMRVIERQRGMEAITILAIIGKAQERFFVTNGEVYATVFQDIDADFIDFSTGQPPTGATFNHRLFTFTISGSTCATGKATAARKTGAYTIQRCFTNGALCCTGTDTDLCDNLGLNSCEANICQDTSC